MNNLITKRIPGLLLIIAGLGALWYWATLDQASIILDYKTPAIPYIPKFITEEQKAAILARHVNTPATSFLGKFFIVHVFLIFLHVFQNRVLAKTSMQISMSALKISYGLLAFLPLYSISLLPLWGQRILLFSLLGLYLIYVAIQFTILVDRLLLFLKKHIGGLVFCLLLSMLIIQAYMLLGPHDYESFIKLNQLSHKSKTNLLYGAIFLFCLSSSIYFVFKTRFLSSNPKGSLLNLDQFSQNKSSSKNTAIMPAQESVNSYPLNTLSLLLAVPVRIFLYIEKSSKRFSQHYLQYLIVLVLLAPLILTLHWISKPLFEYKNPFTTISLLLISIGFLGIALQILLNLGYIQKLCSYILNLFLKEYYPKCKGNTYLPLLLLIIFCIFWIYAISDYAMHRYLAFIPVTLDLGVEHQAMWTLSHHGYPFLSIGEKNGIYDRIFWPDHVPLLYYLLAPLYLLSPRVETLLVLQVLFIGIGCIPVYLLAYRVLKSKIWTFTMASLYLLYPGLQVLGIWDVHANSFCLVFFLFALYFLEADRKVLFLALLFIGGLAREETGLLTMSAGLMLVFSRRDIRLGLVTTIMGLMQFFILSKVIQHYFGGLGHYERYYPLFYFANNFSVQNIIAIIILNPVFFILQSFSIQKGIYVFIMLFPLLFLPVLNRARWLIALAGLASTVLALKTPNFTIGYQYSVFLIIALFYLSVHGLKTLNLALQSPSKWYSLNAGQANRIYFKILPVLILLAGLFSSYYYGALYSKTYKLGFLGPWNHTADLFQYNDWISISTTKPIITPELENLKILIEKIPRDAAISAQSRVNPHLSGRAKNYTVPRVDDAEYIVFFEDFANSKDLASYIGNKDFRIWQKSGKTTILKRIEQ